MSRFARAGCWECGEKRNFYAPLQGEPIFFDCTMEGKCYNVERYEY